MGKICKSEYNVWFYIGLFFVSAWYDIFKGLTYPKRLFTSIFHVNVFYLLLYMLNDSYKLFKTLFQAYCFMSNLQKFVLLTISDRLLLFENEKKILKKRLESVIKIRLITYIWKFSHQVVEYMVIIEHFIDAWWNLQKKSSKLCESACTKAWYWCGWYYL